MVGYTLRTAKKGMGQIKPCFVAINGQTEVPLFEEGFVGYVRNFRLVQRLPIENLNNDSTTPEIGA